MRTTVKSDQSEAVNFKGSRVKRLVFALAESIDNLGVREDGCIEVNGFFDVVVEPEERSDLLGGVRGLN